MHCNIPIRNSESLFTYCEAIASLTVETVSAAEVGSWEVVSMLECESAAYMDALRRPEPHPRLSHADMERERALPVRILEGDAHVRTMVYLRLDRLQRRIDMARHATNVSSAHNNMVHY